MPKLLSSIETKKIYSRYPALVRTSTWSVINTLVRTGEIEKAWVLAEKVSKENKQLNAQNIVARKTRIERVKFFALRTKMLQDLTTLMELSGKRIARQTLSVKNTPSSIRDGKKMISVEMGVLRRALMKWATDYVWESVKLGIRNTEAALLPVFKYNEESLDAEAWQDMNLMEERLSFGMTSTLANNGSPTIAKGSQVYKDVTDKAYQAIVTKNNNGLQLSTRIWELTKRSELEIRRILEQQISQGTSSTVVAKNLEGYLVDEPIKGIGVYQKPRANAERLTRTETNRAYVSAQAQWAKTRGWVKSIMVTLSSAHEDVSGCDCEIHAGEEMDPDKFASSVPFHPHCMCYGTIVIKDEYLLVEEGKRHATVL
jgi:hypothetical protein